MIDILVSSTGTELCPTVPLSIQSANVQLSLSSATSSFGCVCTVVIHQTETYVRKHSEIYVIYVPYMKHHEIVLRDVQSPLPEVSYKVVF